MQGYVVISALTLAASVVNGQNEGCGMAVLDKCYRGFPLNGSTPDILVETVGEIPSVEECQWFCKELYSGECTWFAFDSQTNQCNIFKGSITDYTSSCELVGYPKEPNVADCSTTLTGDDACYNFREGYCRFEDYVILENLQFVQSLEHCQEACRHRPDCKFLLYEEKDKVCHLEGSQKRNCDVVHGLPNPPFGDCLSANKIPFTVHGSLNATSAMSTTAVGIPTTESGVPTPTTTTAASTTATADPDWPETVYVCGAGWSPANGEYRRAVREASGYTGEYQYNKVGTSIFMYRGYENWPQNYKNPASSRWSLYDPTTKRSAYRSQSYQDVKILELDTAYDWDTWNVPSPRDSFDRPYIQTSPCSG